MGLNKKNILEKIILIFLQNDVKSSKKIIEYVYMTLFCRIA